MAEQLLAWTLRKPRPDDLEAILELLAARERADFLTGGQWQAFLLDEWRNHAFDPAEYSIVAVVDSGHLAGLAALFAGGGFAAVHPDHEGQGIGARLLVWLEGRALSDRRGEHRQMVAAGNTRAAQLLHAAGYRHVRSYLQLGRELGESPGAPPDPPEGITLHPLDREADAGDLHALDDLAFSANLDYHPHTFERFRDEHLAPEDVDTRLSLVARRGHEVVGMVICRRRPDQTCLVDLLSVSPSQRGRGLGRCLLLNVFAASAARGLSAVVLGVASDNPTARRLYERAGMVERYRGDVLEKPIAPR